MVLCVGEILVDMIANVTNDGFVYQRKAGGAPFNVACGVNKFNGKGIFLGSVGNDTIGKFLYSFIKKQNLADYELNVIEDRNTTLAFVDLDENGERSFCFYRKNTADYVLPNVPERLWDKTTIIHIGSLMLSEKEGFEYALNLCKLAKEKNKLISFDVNFREDIFTNLDECLYRYKKILSKADIVKFSSEELEYFPMTYINNELKDKLICVSLGSKGSRIIYKNIIKDVPSIKVKPVDTTGAGDAFYAGILSKLVDLPVSEWNEENLTKAFRFGNISGALNTLHKGAIDNLPTVEEIVKFIEN